MIKPHRLQKGDKVAIVSLSRGMLGEDMFIHKFHIAKKRLEEDYGVEVVAMPNALKGIDYLYEHPEARAQDLMDAFRDPEIKAVFNAIGGDDSIRLLPYIDFDVLLYHNIFLIVVSCYIFDLLHLFLLDYYHFYYLLIFVLLLMDLILEVLTLF